MSWEREGETFSIDDAYVVKETAKAILVEADAFFDEPEWVPKKAVHEDSEVWEDSEDGGGPGVLIIKRWFADSEGWTG
jgi:hypothetical protein